MSRLVRRQVSASSLIKPLAAAMAGFALGPPAACAALKSAAGGGKGGTKGFGALTHYLDAIANDLIPVGGALAVLGLIYGGSLLMAGAPHAGRTLTYVVIGVVIVLASKGIAA